MVIIYVVADSGCMQSPLYQRFIMKDYFVLVFKAFLDKIIPDKIIETNILNIKEAILHIRNILNLTSQHFFPRDINTEIG